MPLFWVGTLSLLAGLFTFSLPIALTGFACLLVPVLTQGFGHRRLEPKAPASFSSPWNFIARLALEQWITFPRYLRSGGWARAFRHAR